MSQCIWANPLPHAFPETGMVMAVGWMGWEGKRGQGPAGGGDSVLSLGALSRQARLFQEHPAPHRESGSGWVRRSPTQSWASRHFPGRPAKPPPRPVTPPGAWALSWAEEPLPFPMSRGQRGRPPLLLGGPPQVRLFPSQNSSKRKCDWKASRFSSPRVKK